VQSYLEHLYIEDWNSVFFMPNLVAAIAKRNKIVIRISPGFAKVANAFKDMVLTVMNFEAIR
jgi:hypothetical protein